jgi:hypothetical protein
MKGRHALKKTPYTPPVFGAPSELDEAGCLDFAGGGGGGGGGGVFLGAAALVVVVFGAGGGADLSATKKK